MFERSFLFNQPTARMTVVLGSRLWTFDRPTAWQWSDDSEGWSCAHSWTYLCPTCGEVWGRAVFNASKQEGESLGKSFLHVPVSQPCSKHPTTRWNVAGSLLGRYGPDGLPHDPALLHFMPRELLVREFDLHLAHLERYSI